MATFSQLPSGKWRVQVRRAGIYRAATFETKREARDWATQIEAQAAHVAAGGFAPPPKSATLGDLIDKYRESVDVAPRSSKDYALGMVRRELGHVRLASLSALHLRDFVDRRVADGLKGSSIAGILSTLSAVLKWGRHARRWDISAGLALEARAALAHSKLGTRGAERDREPTDDELEQLYAYWARMGKRARSGLDMPTVVRFALATGMRQGEICRIEIEDIDDQARTVVIRDRKDPRNKAGNDQTVPLLPAAWEIVERVRDERKTGRLFPYSPQAVSDAFARACEQCEIDDLRFHDLRHRATAQFFRDGLQIPQVALLTGHKTWAMLRRYTKITPRDVHAAFAAKVAS